jgi:L-threonine-O-3-phosphate decarboxylase
VPDSSQDSSARPRHGGNIAWAASLAGCSPCAVLDFSASISPLGPPQSAIVALQSNQSRLTQYPDPSYTELRGAIAAHHDIHPDWILPGNGSAELLTWASRELAELHSTTIVTPAFGDYSRALQSFGAKIRHLPIELFNAFPAPPPASGLLLNNPHNPTGQLFPIESILPLLEQFALVVVDEAFMDFLPPSQQQSLMAYMDEYPHLVILRSLTKFYSLPGLRLGYAIAHPDRLQRWQQWRDPWSVNVLAEVAAIAVLQDATFQQQTYEWLAETRSPLYAGLSALPGLHPLDGVANYFLVKSDHSVMELQRALLQKHQILIRDCMSFAELGDRYFRVAVRTTAENQRLLNGLADVLKDLG